MTAGWRLGLMTAALRSTVPSSFVDEVHKAAAREGQLVMPILAFNVYDAIDLLIATAAELAVALVERGLPLEAARIKLHVSVEQMFAKLAGDPKACMRAVSEASHVAMHDVVDDLRRPPAPPAADAAAPTPDATPPPPDRAN